MSPATASGNAHYLSGCETLPQAGQETSIREAGLLLLLLLLLLILQDEKQ